MSLGHSDRALEPGFDPPKIDCCDSAKATGGAHHSPSCSQAHPLIGEVWRPIIGSGRLWKIEDVRGGEYTLRPLGSDVMPAQTGNQMHGGVRRIFRTEGVLLGGWTRVREA